MELISLQAENIRGNLPTAVVGYVLTGGFCV